MSEGSSPSTKQPEGFTVRPAMETDVDALGSFIAPFVERGRLLPRTHDELEDLTVDGFIAESNGQIVGFAALEIYSSKLAELRSLAVSPDQQGRGIGKALVTACVERARQRVLLRVPRPLCGLLLNLRRIPSPTAFQPP